MLTLLKELRAEDPKSRDEGLARVGERKLDEVTVTPKE
jgi:hypothetical protein